MQYALAFVNITTHIMQYAVCFQVLTDELPALVGTLSFKKSMRWGASDVAFSRPLRWLLALHGAAVLPFSFAGLTAGASTRVLRNAPAPEVAVASAEEYAGVLSQHRISLGLQGRKDSIWAAVTVCAGTQQQKCMLAWPACLVCFLSGDAPL